MQNVKVLDKSTNTEVTVGIDEIGPMVASGRYELPLGKSMPVINPEGEIGEVPSEHYATALSQGYTPAKLHDIQKSVDIHNYGDSPLQTGLERAAGSASLGLTDFAASKLAPEYAKQMALREELNPIAATIGEVAGVVGPALLSGGSSLAAKAVSAPVRAIEGIGAKATRMATKALPENLLAKKIIAETIPRAAGMGVEGAMYGAGSMLSDVSLGNADFSAESLISHVGTGALLGGGLGAAIGGAKVLGAPVLQRIKGWNDVNKLAEDFAGLKSVKGQKLADKLGEGELADYIVKDVNGGKLMPFNSENLKEKAASTLEKNSRYLDDVLEVVEKGATNAKALPTKAKLLSNIEGQLNSMEREFMVGGKVVPGQESAVAEISKVRDSWQRFLESEESRFYRAENPASKFVPSNEIMSIKDLNDVRKMIGSAGKFDSATEAVAAQINRELYPAFREIIDGVADKVAMGDKLRELNRKISIGIKLQPFIEKAALQAEKSNIWQARDMLTGALASGIGGIPGAIAVAARVGQKAAETSYVKSARLIYAVKAAESSLIKDINNSVRHFFSESGKATKLASFRLATRPSRQDEDTAYEKFKADTEKYAQNPQHYLERMNAKNIRASQELPQVTAASEAAILRGIQFLDTKIPRSKSAPSILSRPYKPSTQELAKFYRYAEVVQDPTRALKHLQSGTLTRENVEALKTVYPHFYKKLQESIMSTIGKGKHNLPYNRKVQLSTLLGVPLDKSLIPSNIAAYQAGYMPVQDDTTGNAGSVKPTVKGMEGLNMADRMAGKPDDV